MKAYFKLGFQKMEKISKTFVRLHFANTFTLNKFK